MRSTLWFLTINLPLLLSLLAALFLDRVDLSSRRAAWALVGFAALAWVDLWPYVRARTGFGSGAAEAYRNVGRHLDGDPDEFRFAWVPYVPSRAEEAWADRFTGKRDYGSWLLWCSGKWGGRAVARGFAELREALDRTRRSDTQGLPSAQKALGYFALCDVKYFLIHQDHESFRPLFGRGLTPVAQSGHLLVARNEFWRPGRALRFPEDPRGRLDFLTRPDAETIEARFSGSGPVLLSEAYHPYWKAELDGRPVPVAPVADGLLGLRASGAGPHRLRLRFVPPWYYGASALLSIASLLGAAAVFAVLRRG
jgi:hypothetical protein